ncbi:PQQ-binding-like beta-propeller repeat protein [Exilibacterium tricleocarpae]|uniref:PQQ-binding-like beta-propeller repeat protein n=1 Tax=Exilibacterium tricleocarpae TaxID=2591008 RepID=A0A545U3H2_9GAMM|nr:PQQ-binding-like beta-propeller repeat protein [Exilibacterium tricleocarpae]TQV84025.1 PQQ-binding-like beta-propeller repeat protein [Exilibacterium tricleocarpae]
MFAKFPLPLRRGLCSAAIGLLSAAQAAAGSVVQSLEQKTVELQLSGQQLFENRCASCHLSGAGEAPTVDAMGMLGSEKVLAAMTTGVMREMATGLSGADKQAIAAWLAPAPAVGPAQQTHARCAGQLQLTGPPLWNRWGNSLSNARFQPAAVSGLSAGNVKRLQLKWAFGFPGAVRARSQPAVTREALFTGSQDGTIYALGLETGCLWWTFKAEAEVRNAITLDVDPAGKPQRLFFGDFNANVYSLDAATGKLLWKQSVSEHPVATITGSVALHGDRLFVPLSSTEVINAANPAYECCTFRGGVTALDTRQGKVLWRMYTVPEPEKRRKNSDGVQMWGPSGAPIWSTPTVDRKRGLLYVGTGENYSSPANDKSDAIIAIDIDTGGVRWVNQTIANDAWNGSCVRTRINCPEEDGPDFDFGAPPILTTLATGKDIILAGQKSGMVYAMDPDARGRTLWQQRAGMGGYNGGIHWGMTTDGDTLYVPIADTPGHHQTVGAARPGLHAFDVRSGAPLWSRFEPPTCAERHYRCFPALSAAVTLTPGLVFAGGLDGTLHAYSTTDGTPLWTYETHRAFTTVNGVKAKGGSIDSDGAVVANGMLLINSGYDKFREIPGNVLLVFGL